MTGYQFAVALIDSIKNDAMRQFVLEILYYHSNFFWLLLLHIFGLINFCFFFVSHFFSIDNSTPSVCDPCLRF